MDIAFSCDDCGQHILIEEAGAGMTVQCPACNQNLTVPAKVKPAITVNLPDAIQGLAMAIDSGLFDDDQKLDAFLRKAKPEVIEAGFGKKAANSFRRGKISANQLLQSSDGGHELSDANLREIRKIWNETE